MNKVIYSEIDFWEHFEANQLNGFESVKDIPPRLDLFPLLKKSKINFCCSFEVFKERENASEYLKVITKGWSDGRIKDVAFDIPINADRIRNDVDKTVVCLTENDYSQEAEELGVINITPYNYDKLQPISSVYVEKGDSGSWMKITSSIERTCNALVIMDKYLFSNSLDKINELLDCFISKNIKIEFHLTILTDQIVKNQRSFTDEVLEKKKKEIEVKIQKHLSVAHPGVNLIVEIFRIKITEFHDRVLLTNYCYITVGAGFDLFNDKGTARHEGDINMEYPCFTGNDVKYDNRITTAKSEITVHGLESKNRLLL